MSKISVVVGLCLVTSFPGVFSKGAYSIQNHNQHGGGGYGGGGYGGGGYGGGGYGGGGYGGDYAAYPKYNFGYAVNDHYTGDVKHHKESRDGGKVVGEYSLIEPDGGRRTVTYTADHTGFHPIIHRTPGHHGGHGRGGGYGGY